jgi:uncharacterized SAM-binding protein YcdF (DUF218 family)
MATFIAGILKNIVPGSLAFLVLALSVGLGPLVLRRTLSRWQVVWLGAVACCYLVLSLPATATALAGRLSRHGSIDRPEDARGASTVVVFDGDHPGTRMLETIRLYSLLHPQWVVVSSMRGMDTRLARAGIPADRILVDSRSETTREQALNLHHLLQTHGIDRIVLVASPIHMPRVLGACQATGVRAVPSVALMPHESVLRARWRLLPQLGALTFSTESLYEMLALWWYGKQGWIA